MKSEDPRFRKGISDKNWFKKGHKLSSESIEKMRSSKRKYTPEQLKQRSNDRAKDPKRVAWKINYSRTPKRKYGAYKNSARVKDIDFELSFEQFLTLWNKTCSYCQQAIDTIGIDRLDNDRGYTLNNVIPCCKICNYMKRELTYQEFLARCEKITRFHNPFLF